MNLDELWKKARGIISGAGNFLTQPFQQTANTINTVANTKFLPGQQKTISQVLQKPQQLFLPSALANVPKTNPIAPIARPTGQALRGLLGSNTLGLVRTPGADPESLSEKIGYGTGYATGFINPYNLANKAFGVLGAGGAKLGQAGGRLLPAAVQKATPQLLKTGGKVLAEELAQSVGYAGARKLTGQQTDIKSDLLTSIGMRGLFGGAGRVLGNLPEPQSFRMHPEDIDELVNAQDMLKNPKRYLKFRYAKDVEKEKITEIVSEAKKTINLLAQRHLPTDVLAKHGNDYNKLATSLYKLSKENKLGMFKAPGAGFVDDKVAKAGLYDIKGFADATGMKGKELQTAWSDFDNFVKNYTGPKSEAFEAWMAKPNVANQSFYDTAGEDLSFLIHKEKLGNPGLEVKKLSDNASKVIFRDKGGQPVGAIQIEKMPAWDKPKITHTFVDPEYRNKGIGTMLVQKAKSMGATETHGEPSVMLKGILEKSRVPQPPAGLYDTKVEQALIDTAKSYGIDEVISNDKQLKEWTINQIASGNKNVADHLKVVQEAGKPVSISSRFSQPPLNTSVTSPTAPRGLADQKTVLGLPSKPPEVIQPRIEPNLADANLTKQAVQTSPLPEPIKQSLNGIIDSPTTNVKQKVGLLDYLRTPDRVLEKIGLGNQAKALRTAYETYQKQLPGEIDKITQWSKQVSPESNQRIFQWLDGKPMQLDQNEMRVANEVKSYLSEWADKLGLPKDKRITNYITHIFEKDFIQKEFDPEMAKLLQDKVAGSVYDPFTEQRLGKMGYVEDTWRALDAYVKRATRKVNLDPALTQVKKASENLEQSQFSYVKQYIDRVNMRPTQVDNLIDNTAKQIFGYKFGQRPVANLSRGARQMIYRGTLGLNVGSAIKNLTQGANTYAKLGEKHTVLGYAKLFTNGTDELYKQGVLNDEFITDRTLSSTKKFWQTVDKGLFAFFDLAEKINRGSAYYGAKAKALSQGMDETQAIDFAKKIVRDTQFTFGSIDTPPVFQGDVAKTLLQFQSYNLKQAEFLGEMVKSKDFAGLARWTGSSLALVYTIGQAIGMKPEQIIPSFRIGGSPLFSGAGEILDATINSKDQYGNERTPQERLQQAGETVIPFIPGGVQLKKTIQGLDAARKGYSESRSGRVQYVVPQDPITAIRAGLFGKNNLPQAQAYFKEGSVMGENQSKLIKEADDKMGVFNKITDARKQNAVIEKAKKANKESVIGDTLITNDGKTINLAPPTKGEGIDAYTNQNWNVTKAREVWSAKLSTEQKKDAFKKLGVDPKDVEYDYKARKTNDIKAQYTIEKAKTLTHKQLLERMVTGRVVSISGTQFASNGVIDKLRDAGLLSSAEAKALKKLKLDKDGKSLIQFTGSGTGNKKAKALADFFSKSSFEAGKLFLAGANRKAPVSSLSAVLKKRSPSNKGLTSIQSILARSEALAKPKKTMQGMAMA